jgi:predicted nucleic acid-binding Zn ribbon protein
VSRESFNKKSIYTDFVPSSELIADLMETKEFKKAVTRSNLCNFWAKVAGRKFGEKSRPYSMSANNVMIIACENSIVAQELTLRKFQLLEKFKPYLKSLQMTVKDLRFDPKKWQV